VEEEPFEARADQVVPSAGAEQRADLDPNETGAAPEIEGAVADAGESSTTTVALESVRDAVDALGRQFGAFHDRAEQYEARIRSMQAQIEDLQRDQVQALLKPIITKLAALHAHAAEAEARAADAPETALKDLSFFGVSIEETLGLLDVDSVGATPGAPFDVTRHHAVRSVATTDAAADRTIQRVIRQGFGYAGAPRVLLPAQVAIFRLADDAPVEASPIDPISEGAPE